MHNKIGAEVMENILNKLMKYLTKDGLYKIERNDNLFEKGFIDSMAILEIISIIEDESGIEFNPELFNMENFKTLENIEKLIFQELNI